MLILLLIILVVLAVLSYAVDDTGNLTIAPGLCIVAVVFALIVNIHSIVNGRVIDQKIEMYTAENIAIETQIETVVSEYMDYESETFKDLKSDSAIALVSLYPELKSDELVKTQLEVYYANNDKIKKLKESKINVSNAKWWVYFGK